MPTRKTATAQAAPKPTLKSAMNIPVNTLLSRLMYVALLAAFLVIGYLIGKIEALQKSPTVAAQPTAQQPSQQGQQPAQPTEPNPQDVQKKLTLGNFPIKGNDNAKVTIVEFADFRCPFCEKFFSDTEPQIIKDYVDTGKAKLAFRNYAFLGPASVTAANAAECANEQGKFWDYYEYLYKNQPSESDTSMYVTDKLSEIAGTLGMDTSKFSSCLDSKKYDNNVTKDLNDGQAVGVSGTPTFYINGKQIVGAQPYSQFKTIIDAELAKK